MKRRLTWISLVLLLLTLVYWILAVHFAPSLLKSGGHDHFNHHASITFASMELTCILDRRLLLIAVVSGAGKNDLPLLGRHELLEVILSGRWNWLSGIENSEIIPQFLGVTTLRAIPGNRTLMLRILRIPLRTIAALLSVLPTIAAGLLLFAFINRQRRAFRVKRVRKIRLNLGRCKCGYDLRQSHCKCPECGRPIRWLPVNVPLSYWVIVPRVRGTTNRK